MNQLEIFKATVQHQSHEKFLFYAGFTPDLEARFRERLKVDRDVNLREYCGMYAPVEVNLKLPKNRKKPQFNEYFSDMAIPPEGFINHLGVLELPGSIYHFTRYISPLRNAASLAEIEKFPFPDVEGYDDSHMAEEVVKAHQNGRVTCCSITHMYEDSWQIRGYTQFLMDMAMASDNCDFILDKICARNMKRAEAAAMAGVDVLITGDDVANQKSLMFSPEQWRRFMKPRWAKVYQMARQIKPDIQIWYHSDGNIEAIIPELIEIGVTILNPVQPECLDLHEVKKKYGKQLILDGTIGTQTTMPFGTPDEIRQAVRDRKRELGYDGALILSPTHVLEPDVPLDNILAFIEACE